LDGPSCPVALARATLKDIARSNRWFGGRAAVWFGVRELLGRGTAGRIPVSVLDVGAGAGDIATFLVRRGREHGLSLRVIGLDCHRAAAQLCRERSVPSTVADVWSLPFRDRDFDVIILSQVLHHFRPDAAVQLLRVLSRLARRGLVVADLQKSAAAAAGIWLAGWALGFHPVTRRDGVTSVRRGFSFRGLSELLLAAGMRSEVHARPGYRLVAIWRAGAAAT
jgi:ubiquinone/menaquinone biosynthesis C-methylase UbiE